MWFRQSRLTEPISLSAYGFCHGQDGPDSTSSIRMPATLAEGLAVDRVAIAQQPAWCGVIRRRFNHLLRCPDRCRMLRDVEVHDPPTVV